MNLVIEESPLSIKNPILIKVNRNIEQQKKIAANLEKELINCKVTCRNNEKSTQWEKNQRLDCIRVTILF